jgi:hypothetical protein
MSPNTNPVIKIKKNRLTNKILTKKLTTKKRWRKVKMLMKKNIPVNTQRAIMKNRTKLMIIPLPPLMKPQLKSMLNTKCTTRNLIKNTMLKKKNTLKLKPRTVENTKVLKTSMEKLLRQSPKRFPLLITQQLNITKRLPKNITMRVPDRKVKNKEKESHLNRLLINKPIDSRIGMFHTNLNKIKVIILIINPQNAILSTPEKSAL